MNTIKPIPVSAGKQIAEDYGYDQVIIIARKVGDDGKEHVTTYGVDEANYLVAVKIGNFLKFNVLGWSRQEIEDYTEEKNII